MERQPLLNSRQPSYSGRRRISVVDEEHTPMQPDSATSHRYGYEINEALWPGEESEHIAHPTSACAKFPVFRTIHLIRKDVVEKIDDPYSPEQLRSPRMNKMILRPLVDKYYDMDDLSIVYCLLVNRFQFLKEQADQPHRFTVANTRAMLCEILASRILRRFDDNNAGPPGLLLLSHILVAGFDPFQTADAEVIREHSNLTISVHKRDKARPLTALEVAIVSESKTFLSSSPCQKVVDAIYQGRIVYSPTSFLHILPDKYKRKPITLYDPMSAPLLNQYRLNVPRTRTAMELAQFSVLLILYICVMDEQVFADISKLELVFDFYAWGWLLDQFACMLEHGWTVYTQNLWAFLDVIFMIDFVLYFILRVNAHMQNDVVKAEFAFDILSAGAPVLIPRLAFNLLSENMLFLSLRAMMSDFIVLTFLAVWCFGGFMLALNWLGHEKHDPITIAKWMLYVWFGLDGSGIDRSVDFNHVLGPILMVMFAFLGNTLFLTILVSMLTNTFANIVSNATAEIQFRRTVLTFESVKADAIFAFYPPFNLFAILVLLPLKFVVSPRWWHKLIVYFARTINAPWLLLIGWFERRQLWHESRRAEGIQPRRWPWDTSKLAAHYDIQAVFEAETPESISDGRKDDTEGEADAGTGTNTTGPNTGTHTPSTSAPFTKGQAMRAIAPLTEVADQLQNVLQDFDPEEQKEQRDRLAEMEASIARVEKMVQHLAEVAGDNAVAGRGQWGGKWHKEWSGGGGKGGQDPGRSL